MRLRGRDVLYAIRDLERAEDFASYSTASEIARMVERKDGRAVTQTLMRLEEASLVLRVGHADPHWRTTERGREVERITSACDAARGGSFRPLYDVVTELSERLALAL